MMLTAPPTSRIADCTPPSPSSSSPSSSSSAPSTSLAHFSPVVMSIRTCRPAGIVSFSPRSCQDRVATISLDSTTTTSTATRGGRRRQRRGRRRRGGGGEGRRRRSVVARSMGGTRTTTTEGGTKSPSCCESNSSRSSSYSSSSCCSVASPPSSSPPSSSCSLLSLVSWFQRYSDRKLVDKCFCLLTYLSEMSIARGMCKIALGEGQTRETLTEVMTMT